MGGDGANLLADGTSVHLVLYKFDTCLYCRRVFEELDQRRVQVEYRDVRRSLEHREELRRLTGRSQVPCLVIDGRPLLESAEIRQWLADRFPRIDR